MAARARARGAVMVEAIVVISFFILCFIGVVYFRALYVQKVRVQRLARTSAMAHAMGACETDPRAAIARDAAGRRFSNADAEGVPFDVIPSLPAAGGEKGQTAFDRVREKKDAARLDRMTTVTLEGDARVTAKRKVRRRVNGRNEEVERDDGFSSVARSTSFVVCADPVRDDGFETMVETVARVF